MDIYIRDRDFGAVKKLSAVEWEFFNDNTHDSSFTVLGEVSDSYSGGVITVYNPPIGTRCHASIVNSLTPKDNTTVIKTKPLIELLDRDVTWLDGPEIGSSFRAMITANWGAGQLDTYFKAAWLVLGAGQEWNVQTGIFQPELDEVGMCNLKKCLLDAQDAIKAYFIWTATANNVTCGVYEGGWSGLRNPEKIDFTLGEYELKSETYAEKQVAKITLHTYDDTSQEWGEVDYYLLQNGSYTTDSTATTRVRGEWKHLIKKTEADVKTEFAKNQLSHKICFNANKVLDEGNTVEMRMPDGRVVQSRVSCVKHSSKDDRVYYECGTLATTMTEMVKKGITK